MAQQGKPISEPARLKMVEAQRKRRQREASGMDDICQCPRCGRMHRHLGTPPTRTLIDEIEARVRPTICDTFSFGTGESRREGRVSEADFERLMRMLKGA